MIEIKNVSKSYLKNKKVVDNINLKIEDGLIFGFIGPNGAGKTTTMEMITGILDIDEGEILIDGINIKKEPIKAKSKFGFVPDSPDAFEKLTGVEYLNFIADVYGIDQKTRFERIAKLMKIIPISLYKQFKYKLYPGLIANGIIALMITLCYTLLMPNINIIFSTCLFIILIELCLIEEKVMVLVDLHDPKITWTSEYTMMKENVNVMYEFFYAVIVILLLVPTIFIIKNTVTLLILLLAVLTVINVLINNYVKRHQIKLFNKI